MGVAYDVGVTNRPGARFGPRALRDMSLHSGNFHHPWPYDVRDRLRIVDYGDVGVGMRTDLPNFMIEDTQEHARKILSASARLLTLGGDHTIPTDLSAQQPSATARCP
jgi:agmatinase